MDEIEKMREMAEVARIRMEEIIDYEVTHWSPRGKVVFFLTMRGLLRVESEPGRWSDAGLTPVWVKASITVQRV